jgi:hypothetical protein
VGDAREKSGPENGEGFFLCLNFLDSREGPDFNQAFALTIPLNE